MLWFAYTANQFLIACHPFGRQDTSQWREAISLPDICVSSHILLGGINAPLLTISLSECRHGWPPVYPFQDPPPCSIGHPVKDCCHEEHVLVAKSRIFEEVTTSEVLLDESLRRVRIPPE